jgi:hypothetical protein
MWKMRCDRDREYFENIYKPARFSDGKRQSVTRFIRTQMAQKSPRPPLTEWPCALGQLLQKLSARKMWLRALAQCLWPSVCVSASAIVCLIGHCRVISVSPAFSLWLHPAALRTNARERTVDLHASIKFDTLWVNAREKESSASGKCGWWKTISCRVCLFLALKQRIQCIFRVRSRTLQLLTLLSRCWRAPAVTIALNYFIIGVSALQKHSVCPVQLVSWPW